MKGMLVEEDTQTEDVFPNARKCTAPEISVLKTSDIALNANQQYTRNERILSMRKIKSRNAARSRRGKENYEFYELAKLLPIPTDTSSQLDKASVIRLTMSFLKMREFNFCNAPYMTNAVPPPNRTVKDASESVKSTLQEAEVSKIFENHLGSRILQSLDGFMFVLNCCGRFLYISETVSIYLGLSQVEMIGSSIFDYTYPEDRDELALNLGLTLSSRVDKSNNQKEKIKAEGNTQGARSFFIRMKSTLTKRGVSPKSSCYKVIYVSARAQKSTVKSYHGTKVKLDEATCLKKKEALLGVIAFGCSLSLQNRLDLPLDRNVFVVRVNPAFQFTYCDKNISLLFGYAIHEIVGQNFYHSLHAKDAEKLRKCHVELLTKGNVRTPYYRWLHKSGGYRWVYSSISLMANQRLYPDQTFIWVNHVISNVYEGDMVFDVFQLPPEERERRSKVAKRSYDDRSERVNNEAKLKIPCLEEDLEMMNAQHHSGKNSIDGMENTSDVITDEVTEKSKGENGAINLKMNIHSFDKSDENNNNAITDGADDATESAEVKRSGEQIVKERSGETGCDEAEIVGNSCATDNRKCSTRPKSISLRQKQTRLKEDSQTNETSGAVFESVLDEHKVKVLCVTSKIPKVNSKHSKKQNFSCTESVSEYMDADSTLWENPPNKEISNHNDLPPGIKQMHGSWSVRHTPSAVHHHYPFGINPTLLHSNPLLAKIMMNGWGHQLPHANSFVLKTPVHLMPDCDEMSSRGLNNISQDLNTQASVAAVLEELKKDPLHKVSPPNKVICPELQEGEREKALSDSDCINGVPRATTHAKPMKTKSTNTWEKTESSSKTVAALNLYAGDVARAQAIIQMPSTILLPPSSMFLNRSDASIIALDSDSAVRLSLPSAHFQQHVNSCVLQPFSLSQVAKVRTVPF